MKTTKAFPSKISMLQDLAKRVDGIDLNSSAFLPNFSFVTDKGDSFICPTAIAFVQSFNSVFGDILDLNGTRTTSGGRGKCILTFVDKKEVVVVEEIKVEVVEVSSEDDSEASTDVKFDLAYAESLKEDKSKKEAKLTLEAYGRTLGLELNRQLTFANMIKELQKGL